MGKNYRANVVKRMYTVEMQFSCGEDETVCREATLRVFAENPESALRTALHSISEDMRSAASFTGVANTYGRAGHARTYTLGETM